MRAPSKTQATKAEGLKDIANHWGVFFKHEFGNFVEKRFGTYGFYMGVEDIAPSEAILKGFFYRFIGDYLKNPKADSKVKEAYASIFLQAELQKIIEEAFCRNFRIQLLSVMGPKYENVDNKFTYDDAVNIYRNSIGLRREIDISKETVLGFLKEKLTNNNLTPFSDSDYMSACPLKGIQLICDISGPRVLHKIDDSPQGRRYEISLPGKVNVAYTDLANKANKLEIDAQEFENFLQFVATYFPEVFCDQELFLDKIKGYISKITLEGSKEVISKNLIGNSEVLEWLCSSSKKVADLALSYYRSMHAELAFYNEKPRLKELIKHYEKHTHFYNNLPVTEIQKYANSSALILALETNDAPFSMNWPYQTNILEFKEGEKIPEPKKEENFTSGSPPNNNNSIMDQLKKSFFSKGAQQDPLILKEGFYSDYVEAITDQSNELCVVILRNAQFAAEGLKHKDIFYNSSVRDYLILMLYASYKNLEDLPRVSTITVGNISREFSEKKLKETKPLNVAKKILELMVKENSPYLPKNDTKLYVPSEEVGMEQHLEKKYRNEIVGVPKDLACDLFARRAKEGNIYKISDYINQSEAKLKNQAGGLLVQNTVAIPLSRYINHKLKSNGAFIPSVEVIACLVAKEVCSNIKLFKILTGSYNSTVTMRADFCISKITEKIDITLENNGFLSAGGLVEALELAARDLDDKLLVGDVSKKIMLLLAKDFGVGITAQDAEKFIIQNRQVFEVLNIEANKDPKLMDQVTESMKQNMKGCSVPSTLEGCKSSMLEVLGKLVKEEKVKNPSAINVEEIKVSQSKEEAIKLKMDFVELGQSFI